MKAGFLSGYKTKILAALTILIAVAGWATGELTIQQALEYGVAGGFAFTFRDAMKRAE